MKDRVERVVRARYPEARELTWLPCTCGTCGGRDGTMLAVSKFGPVKDPERKEHPCFVPYDQLPAAQRAKDHIFNAVVRAVLAAAAES